MKGSLFWCETTTFTFLRWEGSRSLFFRSDSARSRRTGNRGYPFRRNILRFLIAFLRHGIWLKTTFRLHWRSLVFDSLRRNLWNTSYRGVTERVNSIITWFQYLPDIFGPFFGTWVNDLDLCLTQCITRRVSANKKLTNEQIEVRIQARRRRNYLLVFIWSLSGIEDTRGEHNARRQWSRICPGFTLKWVIYHFSWETIIRALVLTHFIRLLLGESSICDETRLTTETVCWGTELCVWRLSRNSILESAKNIEASVGHYSRNHVYWIYQAANSVCHHRTSPSWTTTKI